MEIEAEHRFARPLAEVWAMFLDPQAHVGRYADMGHHDIEIVSQERGDDELGITIVRTVDGEVPAIARKFIKPTNTITTTDRWERDAEGVPTGRTKLEIRHVPISASATARLTPDGDDACVYAIELTVSLNVPLVGDRIAKALRPQLRNQLEEEFTACERWLADHPAAG